MNASLQARQARQVQEMADLRGFAGGCGGALRPEDAPLKVEVQHGLA